jgi:hypothetical protein
MTRQAVTRALARGLLTLEPDGLIETENPLNAAYLASASHGSAAEKPTYTTALEARRRKLVSRLKLDADRHERAAHSVAFASMGRASLAGFLDALAAGLKTLPRCLPAKPGLERWLEREVRAALIAARDSEASFPPCDFAPLETGVEGLDLDGLTLIDAQARLDDLHARRNNFKRLLNEGRLLKREDARQVFAQLNTSLKTHVLDLPPRIAPRLEALAASQGIKAARAALALEIKASIKALEPFRSRFGS